MNTNPKIHLVDIPIGGNGGIVWNRLHSEREDICEVILKDRQSVSEADSEVKDPVDTTNWHQELLQARLRKIDDALDRLMSGSYGKCIKCGRCIEEFQLDPAMAFCRGCWKVQQDQTQPVSLRQTLSHVGDSTPGGRSSLIEVGLETLRPFDTILVRTLNSDYRILLLEPRTGRALVEGGHYLIEPREALLSGSKLNGSLFNLGSIVVGCRLEMWVDGKLLSTSRVQSISVEHHESAESIEAITAQIQ
jgi:RNA polymerase-binding transcription factor DksA